MLKRLGLASRIELNTLKDLQKKFPGSKVILGDESSEWPRKRQLRKRGTKIGQLAPLQDEILRITKRIGRFALRRGPRK